MSVLAIGVCGCLGTNEKEVVVYAALDKEFSEPILNDFEKQEGVFVFQVRSGIEQDSWSGERNHQSKQSPTSRLVLEQ